MSNRSFAEDATEEKALKLFSTPDDDLELAVAKITDEKLLKAVWLLAYQDDNDRVRKVIEAKQRELGFSVG